MLFVKNDFRRSSKVNFDPTENILINLNKNAFLTEHNLFLHKIFTHVFMEE